MRSSLSLVLAVAMLAVPHPAWASFECSGTINAAYLAEEGSVIIRGTWRNHFTQVCNLKTEWKGITPDICAGWKAMIDAAVSLGRTINVYYNDSSSCVALSTYSSAPAPHFVMLQ